MKTKFTSFLFCIFCLMQINAQTVSIPNKNFLFILTEYAKKYYVAEDLNGNTCTIDTNGNGKIELSEAENISFLNIGTDYYLNLDFGDLEGIQSFKNLKEISFYRGKVGNANLSNLTKLETISASQFISITSLNLSGCTNLTNVSIYNANLTSLQLSGCTNLKGVILQGNSLASLDLSNLTNLEELSIRGNKLTSLNLSNCSKLKSLDVSGNGLNALDLSGCTGLIKLDCHNNELTLLKVNNLTNLTELGCERNQLTTLDVSNLINLKFLDTNYNKINTLDLSKNKNLVGLELMGNGLKKLYIKNGRVNKDWDNLNIFWGNPLEYICCDAFDQETLKARAIEYEINPVITSDCDNEEPTLNFPDPKFLTYLLQSSPNSGIAKDLNGNTCAIDTNGNGKIEVSEAKNISFLNLIYDYKGIFRFDSSEGINGFINLKEVKVFTPGSSGSLNLSNLKKLEKIASETSPETITKLNISGCTNLKEILIPNQSLTALDVSYLTNLEKLNIAGNKVNSLNLSNCNGLKSLDVTANELSSLDLSGCTSLQELECSSNKLTSLDLSHSTNLVQIGCDRNQLKTLDVSKLINLKILNASDNSINSLDVSKNINLAGLEFINNGLKTLYIKTGKPKMDWDNLNVFMGNPTLAYICCDAFDQEIIKTKVAEYGINPVINSDCNNTSTVEPVNPKLYDSVQASPNPAKDKIHFTEQVKTVEIYNLSGRLALSATINSNEMNISQLQPGTYILKIKTNSGTYTQKLIKL